MKTQIACAHTQTPRETDTWRHIYKAIVINILKYYCCILLFTIKYHFKSTLLGLGLHLLRSFHTCLRIHRVSQEVLVVKNLPANAGDIRDVGSISGLGRSLEEDRAIQSSILAWRIPGIGETGRLQFIGSQRV